MDITTRKQALLLGQKYFYTGKPCGNMHLSKRYTSNYICFQCNSEGSKLRRKTYRHRYKEYDRLYNKRYKQENKEAWASYMRKYQIANKEIIVALSQKYRAKKRKAIGRFTKQDVQEIFKMQKGKCGYCKKKLKKGYHVDHIIALSKGGSNYRANIQILCQKCNNEKSAKDPIDYAKTRGLLL